MWLELWIGEDQPGSIHGRGLHRLGFLSWCSSSRSNTVGIEGWHLLAAAAAGPRRRGGDIVAGMTDALLAPGHIERRRRRR